MYVYNNVKITKKSETMTKQGGRVFETVHFENKLVILFSNGLSDVKPEREKNKIVSRFLAERQWKKLFSYKYKIWCAGTCYFVDHIYM